MIVTILAFPTIWWLSRSNAGAATVAETSAGFEIAAPVDGNVINPIEPMPTAPPTTEPSGPNLPPVEAPAGDPTFMDGPVAAPSDGVAEIAVPAPRDVEPVRADATYQSSLPGVRSCLVQGFRNGQTLRVTNVDNGRSVTCVAALAPAGQDEVLILHTEAFELLADLTEAPIPVEIQA